MSSIPMAQRSPTQTLQLKAGNDGAYFTATAYRGQPAGLSTLVSGQPNLGFTSLQAKGILSGHETWIFTQTANATGVVAFGVLTRGLLSAGLDVCILPHISEEHHFWDVLQQFAARVGVTSLLIESIGFPLSKAVIPQLPGECQRYTNVKLYVVDLVPESWDKSISSNHRRNINKARKHSLEVVSSAGSSAVEAHLSLIGASLHRRARRGEPTNLASDAAEVSEILSSDSAQLYQAKIGSEIVSSKIIFTLGDYAFYDSGGTSEKGMRIGASHFLMYSIMSELHSKGIKSLNLDVASKAAGGLARYKADFGAQLWEVDRVECDLTSLPRRAMNALRSVHERIRPSSPSP